MQETQATFDARLAAEKLKWEEEKERTDRSQNEALAAIERMKKRQTTMQSGFGSESEEKNEEDEIDELTTRGKSTDEQLAEKEKELQICEKKLDEEKKRLEGLAKIEPMPAGQQSNDEQLRQDLVRQKASNEALRQSLAEFQPRKESQPPVEDGAARLQKNLQAHLERNYALDLAEQEARMMNIFRKNAEVFLLNKDAELGKTVAKASEESRRLQKALSNLEKDLQAFDKELEWQQRVSQGTRRTIQSLRDRERRLEEDKRRLFRSKKELEASLKQKTKDCRQWSMEVTKLKTSLKRAERIMEAIRGEAEEMTQAKEAAQIEVRSLRAANRALRAEKTELKAKSGSAFAELTATFAEMDRCQIQSERLTAELRRVGGRLAETEAEEIARALETTQIEARSLRVANRVLSAEKTELEAKSGSAIAELTATFAELDRCQIQSERLTAELRRVGGRLAETEAEEIAQAKDAAQIEARSLRAANRALSAEKTELEAKSGSATAELTATFAELDRCQIQSERLTAELRRVGGQLAKTEAIIEKKADGVREPKLVVDLRFEEWVRLEEWAAWDAREKREKKMDALLGVPEMAEEEFLFSSGKDLVFWLLVGLLSGMLLVAFSAASAANRERQMWLGSDAATRRAVVSLRTGKGLEVLWHDPLLDLSRGMYGV